MNGLCHRNHMFYWSIREDSVAQIKDMAWPAASATENLRYLATDLIDRSQQSHRVQVPLDPDVIAHGLPGLVQIDPPVQADDISSRGAYMSEQSRGSGAEMDDRNPTRERLDSGARIGKDVLLIVLR